MNLSLIYPYNVSAILLWKAEQTQVYQLGTQACVPSPTVAMAAVHCCYGCCTLLLWLLHTVAMAVVHCCYGCCTLLLWLLHTVAMAVAHCCYGCCICVQMLYQSVCHLDIL